MNDSRLEAIEPRLHLDDSKEEQENLGSTAMIVGPIEMLIEALSK